jgi:hypothetical protein
MKRDPVVVVLLALAVAAVVMVGLGAAGVASTSDVTIQIPYAVSGGVGGLGLLVASLGLLTVHLSRKDAARRRNEIDELIAVLEGRAE